MRGVGKGTEREDYAYMTGMQGHEFGEMRRLRLCLVEPLQRIPLRSSASSKSRTIYHPPFDTDDGTSFLGNHHQHPQRLTGRGYHFVYTH